MRWREIIALSALLAVGTVLAILRIDLGGRNG
jgi:hypothetical protein